MNNEMNSTRLLDYHLHTFGTIDGKMTEDQVCERALILGIKEIAFTNHAMLTEPAYKISYADFKRHCENIQTCQKRYPELTIRLGLEIDYYGGMESEVSDDIQQYEILAERPLDLVLGAIHHLNGVFFSNQAKATELYKNNDIVSLYRDYFSLATHAVQSHLFDVMAHPDLIKKFTGELSPKVPFEKYQAAVEPYIIALLECNVGIEVNTKGLIQSGGEAYPSDELLELYLTTARAHGKQPLITLGSDAHDVAGVSMNLVAGAKMLFQHGCTTIMKYEKRNPTPVSLLAE